MRQLVPLLASLVTVINMWLAGNHDKRAWILGIINQIIWIAFIVMFDAWGLLPLSAVLVVIYSRNLIKWSKEETGRRENV